MKLLNLIWFLIITNIAFSQTNPGLVTTNIISRTIYIQYNESSGTAFVFDYNKKQYFITAKHVVSALKENDTISIFHKNIWNKLKVKLVGHSKNSDISVFSSPDYLDKSDNLIANSNNLIFSQEIFFLGFPYGLTNSIQNVNSGFPIPYIKKGILSNVLIDKDFKVLFLDGINNPGFSGGPIIYQNKLTGEFNLCGIISGYRPEINNIKQNNQDINLQYSINTGIIIGYGIEEAIKLIQSNPIGSEL
jgi:hypothetical protein